MYQGMMIILQIVDSFSQEAKETTLSALKAWLEEDEGFIDSLVGAENMAIKKKAKEILEDTSIQSNIASVHKSYPLMDRVVHRTEDYLFALSLYSERIQNTEIMNDENRFGWHQNNGMTYIYDEDKQYTENYWNTVNPLRLPGTTVVPVNIGTGKPDGSGFAQSGDFCSKESWVGGTSIGSYGVSGMSFLGETQGIAGDAPVSYAPDLKGKKSWFMFDDEIVCLGAGITNKNMELPVETTIENKKLRKDGSNQLLVNGEKTEILVKEANVKELVERTADVSGTSFEQVNWAHLEGNQSVGTGYYFPEENTEIQVRRGQTTGRCKDVGTFDGESTENYLEMWVDHGQNPENASYSYVLLLETSAEETENYAQAPKVTILENSSEVQAVRHETLKITGINFWQEQGGSVDGITSDKVASVMLQETEQGTVKVSVSDPTMKNKGNIQLPISEKYNGKEVVVLSCDNEKVKKLKGKVKNGFVSVEVESLNSFGTVLDKAVSSGVDKVKTGDETPFVMLFVMFIVGGTLFVVLKRKKKA